MPQAQAERSTLEVAAGLLRDADRVLVCQRSERGAHPGRWEFPGGKLEAGETAHACLVRELKEELSIDAEIGELLQVIEFEYPAGPRVRIQFFAVPTWRGAVENRVFARIVWQPLSRLPELDFLQADLPLVARLAAEGGG